MGEAATVGAPGGKRQRRRFDLGRQRRHQLEQQTGQDLVTPRRQRDFDALRGRRVDLRGTATGACAARGRPQQPHLDGFLETRSGSGSRAGSGGAA
jgi:hypothetical protein